MTKILSGAPVVEALGTKMKTDVEFLKTRNITPTLAIVRIGENPDDISYEKNATRRCESVGVNVRSVCFPDNISQNEIINTLESLNSDINCHGVLLFRPLPNHLNERDICEVLDSGKDVDCITLRSLAEVFTGSANKNAQEFLFAPCTAQAVLEILDFYAIDCLSKNVVVVGRSLVVGKPVAIMLLSRNATVTICHTRTLDLPKITANADIIIVATGKPEGLTKEYFKPGQIVIDVGINWNESKGSLCGDVMFDEVMPIVDAITPVPGGVGTVTTSVLVSNVVKAALKTIS